MLKFCAAAMYTGRRPRGSGDDPRPGLLFREDFKETPAETPITQGHIAGADLVLSVHGPGKSGLKKSHHDKPDRRPLLRLVRDSERQLGGHTCGISKLAADLTGLAKIRWRTKQSRLPTTSA